MWGDFPEAVGSLGFARLSLVEAVKNGSRECVGEKLYSGIKLAGLQTERHSRSEGAMLRQKVALNGEWVKPRGAGVEKYVPLRNGDNSGGNGRVSKQSQGVVETKSCRAR